jgi:hypothetical protein
MERFDQCQRAVGKCQGKYIHELFLTSLPVEQFTATDVLNLYNGRGGFEQTLSQEDTEQDGDRWCSWQAQGQSFWQILTSLGVELAHPSRSRTVPSVVWPSNRMVAGFT